MSEPLVQRALKRMPYKTSLVIVFFSALIAAACAGNLMAHTPEVWSYVGNRTGLPEQEIRKSLTGAGVGLMFCIVPGLLVDRSTPMLCSFIFSALAFAGYFPLFWMGHGSLVGLSWPVVGVFFLLIGQSLAGVLVLGTAIVSFNAPSGRRGFVVAAVVAALAAGTLIWTLVESTVFDLEQRYAYYVLCLSLVVPFFYFLAAFLLFKVEQPTVDGGEVRPTIAPLFGGSPAPSRPQSASLLAENATTIDDELDFKSDMDYRGVESPTRKGAQGHSRAARVLSVAALALVVPCSAVWLVMQSEVERPLVDVPYLWPGAFILSALLTGFFSDFFYTFARPWWVFLAGLVGAGSHIIMAFKPHQMYYGQQLLQGAVLSSSVVAGVTHLSHEYGLDRLGLSIGVLGMASSLVFVTLVAFLFYEPNGVLSDCRGERCRVDSFVFTACLSVLGSVLAAVAARVDYSTCTTPRSREIGRV